MPAGRLEAGRRAAGPSGSCAAGLAALEHAGDREQSDDDQQRDEPAEDEQAGHGAALAPDRDAFAGLLLAVSGHEERLAVLGVARIHRSGSKLGSSAKAVSRALTMPSWSPLRPKA